MPVVDLTALARLVAEIDPAGLPVLDGQWQRHVDGLVHLWLTEVQPAQLDVAVRQIELAVTHQNLDALAALQLPVLGEASLLAAMQSMAAAGAASVLAEARAQGALVTDPPLLAAFRLADWARTTARRLTESFAAGLAAAALRLTRPGAHPIEVSDGVRAYVATLSDAGPRGALGGALTQAQNLGRLSVYERPPPGWRVRMFADETLDQRTCKPCEEVAGVELPTLEAAALAYGGAGYLHCLGTYRCRGTMIGIWSKLDPTGAFLQRVALDRVYKRDGAGRFAREWGAARRAELGRRAKEAAKLPDDHYLTLSEGASGAGVRLIRLPGGERLVHKRASGILSDWDGGRGGPRKEADAEALGSLTGLALSAEVATVIRDEDDGAAVWIDHIDGRALTEFPDDNGEATHADFDTFYDSPAGYRLGLLDVLIGNEDRNDGNLIIDEEYEGVVTGIDHGFAFAYEDPPDLFDLHGLGGPNAPAQHYVERTDKGLRWRDNPMTPDDVEETRGRLEALRPKYRDAGREAWLDAALGILGQMAPHAKGKVSIYDD